MFKVQGSGFGVQGSRFRVQGSGFRNFSFPCSSVGMHTTLEHGNQATQNL
jgi:hypothetical protein